MKCVSTVVFCVLSCAVRLASRMEAMQCRLMCVCGCLCMCVYARTGHGWTFMDMLLIFITVQATLFTHLYKHTGVYLERNFYGTFTLSNPACVSFDRM